MIRIKRNPVLIHQTKLLLNFTILRASPRKNFPAYPIIIYEFPVVCAEIIDGNL